MKSNVCRILTLAVAALVLSGCAEEGPAERAGARLDDALGEARERFDDVRDEAEEAAEDLREALEGEE